MASITNPITRNLSKPTRTNSINAKCAECVGCDANHLESGFKAQISQCSSYRCPLYAFRPYQVKNSLERQKNGSYKHERP